MTHYLSIKLYSICSPPSFWDDCVSIPDFRVCGWFEEVCGLWELIPTNHRLLVEDEPDRLALELAGGPWELEQPGYISGDIRDFAFWRGV